MRNRRESSVLVLATRGLKARHRHLMRDVLRLLPHGIPGSKLDTEENSLAGVVSACEDADCGSALLFDARDAQRLFLWTAACPDGPSAMFRVRNTHTASELNLEARRCGGVRNLLAFDRAFERPRAAPGVERVKHAMTFSWVDERIWLRVYRIGPDAATGELDVVEIGPRLVLEPVRIIAAAFGGAVLHTHPKSSVDMVDEEE